MIERRERMGVRQQMELFPSVTAAEKLETRNLLKDYTKMRMAVQKLSKKDVLNKKEQEIMDEWPRLINEIDTAVELILDEEAKDIIKYRYIRGRKYKYTIIHFKGYGMSETTIDRRIDEGVRSIAETLKLCGILGVSWG